MSKEVSKTAEVIEPAAPDISHYPIVAEGTGKSANNEGAQAKTVYNVSAERRCIDFAPALLY
jgi:hypothetical protein